MKTAWREINDHDITFALICSSWHNIVFLDPLQEQPTKKTQQRTIPKGVNIIPDHFQVMINMLNQ